MKIFFEIILTLHEIIDRLKNTSEVYSFYRSTINVFEFYKMSELSSSSIKKIILFFGDFPLHNYGRGIILFLNSYLIFLVIRAKKKIY